MREIKFRAVSTKHHNMIFGDLVHGAFCFGKIRAAAIKERGHIPHPVDLETVGQYIGRKDANDVEIYEGDILEFDINKWGGNDNIHVVSWDEKEAQWCFGGGCQYSDMQFRKIIGNVHENPNLLTNE